MKLLIFFTEQSGPYGSKHGNYLVGKRPVTTLEQREDIWTP